DAVEPGGEALTLADAAGLADEDEEGGLEGVVGLVGVAQHLAADTADERPVAAEEGLEGGRVAAGDEAGEQLAVAAVGGRAGKAAELSQDVGEVPVGHGPALPQGHNAPPGKSDESGARISHASMRLHGCVADFVCNIEA